MKNIILYMFAFVAVFATGCEKYLDQAPDQRTTLNSPDKVARLLVTAYPRGNYSLVAEGMSDNIVYIGPPATEYVITRDAYDWKDVQDISQDSPIYYWNSCYAAIAAANQALDAIEHASDPQNYAAQKGEALVARAYAHFMLVTFYAKPYDLLTSATDIGVPYVMEPENVVFKQYDRKTVAYVYEQIEKDLVAGMPLIRDNKYDVAAYHFTKKAAYGFASRFYLFKKDYAKVIEYANKAFPANDFANNARPWKSYANITGSSNVALALTSATDPGNLLIAETVSRAASQYARSQHAMSQGKLDEIKAPLGTAFTAYKTYSYDGGAYYYVPKAYAHFNRTSINATTGTYYNMKTLLSTEEVLLNRAEGYIYEGQYDEAIKDFNTLLSVRLTVYSESANGLTDSKITTYYASSTSDKKEAYIKAVLDLRRAEFVSEGMRWLDILRYKMPVSHRDKSGNTKVLTADDNRRQWQLPEEVTLSGIPLNPR